MTTTLEASYQPLQPFGAEIGEADETPQESGVMIHVVPESGRARWNHIEDLDSFFARMYHYHQKHGFTCMMLQETFELFQFVFVVVFSTFLLHCVDYPILFRDKDIKANKSTASHPKISLSDAVLPINECVASLGFMTWMCIIVAVIFWILRVVKVVYHLFQFWDIKAFYNTALKINDSELDNITWHSIQCRVREVQLEQQMCIHKRDLTELDIYHRILRFKNYMIAMVNKSLLPVPINVPIIGEVKFLTHGLKYNLDLLLFWGPGSLFENNWHLKEDYKKAGKRKELANQLAKRITYVGIANFILCPVILVWQILYSFFNYAEVIKREPGSLGSRCWSLYGRLYLRHFNELDHELNARLNRAYRPASQYMNSFTSPLMTVIAKNVAFVVGAFLAVLLILTVYDEDVLTVEHVLTAITVFGAIIAICRVFLPDENLVWIPEKLMTAVLAQVHYLPDSWRGQAHTHRVRKEFSQLFQYKAVYLLEELLSPILTPIILCCYVRHQALDIVDFYRNFTVEVVGVGDVCSFAQMDVRRHGNPTWQPTSATTVQPKPSGTGDDHLPKILTQGEGGKTELSLLHFTLTNPNWTAPAEAQLFMDELRNNVKRDANQLAVAAVAGGGNAFYSSLQSISSLGIGFNSLVASIIRTNNTGQAEASQAYQLPCSPPSASHMYMGGGISRAEGPLYSDRGILYNLNQGLMNASLGASALGSGPDVIPEDPLELTVADMSLSTLYLHEMHHRQIRRRGTGYQDSSENRGCWPRLQGVSGMREQREETAERTPLLDSALKTTRLS